eukprot:TRINITY_DN31026_c0_g1_i2.p1 TRINITY_DN31026_c0_g1~~TRINITY_DN31026_c0_g1_i2.p1  ORF type:complete len:514 (-),score=33.89 TRINITY_DN31026_c0_g1_i2:149-1690(-)
MTPESRLSMSGSEDNSDEEDDSDDQPLLQPEQRQLCLRAYLVVVLLTFLSGLWHVWPLFNVGDWFAASSHGPLVIDSPDFSAPGKCPCHCRKNARDLLSLGDRDKAACTPGRICMFTDSWCRAQGHEPAGQTPKGKCLMGQCDGPFVSFTPNSTCRDPPATENHVEAMVRGWPLAVLNQLRSVEDVDKQLARVLSYHGIGDVALSVDEALVEGLAMVFNRVESTWKVDCWPSQRYALLHGYLEVPSGTVKLDMYGLTFSITFSAFRIAFDKLRADLQCHLETFVIGAFGSDAGLTPLRAQTFQLSGSVEISCDPAWAPTCWFVRGRRARLSETLLEQAPGLVLSWMQLARDLPVQGGSTCPQSLHNAVDAKPYVRQECCEAAITLDDTGCLTGGQFELPTADPFRNPPHVECTKLSGHWRARCDRIPGKYRYSRSRHLCIEHELLPEPYRCDTCASTFDAKVYQVRRVTLGLRLLLATALMLIALPCCLCSKRSLSSGDVARTPSLLHSDSLE